MVGRKRGVGLMGREEYDGWVERVVVGRCRRVWLVGREGCGLWVERVG